MKKNRLSDSLAVALSEGAGPTKDQATEQVNAWRNAASGAPVPQHVAVKC